MTSAPRSGPPRVNTQIVIVACPHQSFPLGETLTSESQRITAIRDELAGDCRFVRPQHPK
jgi:hypothetical protein